MSRPSNEEPSAERVTDDPLVQRVSKRSQSEWRRRAWNDAFFGDNAHTGNNGIGLAIIFVLTTLWAIVVSIFEAIPYEWHRAKQTDASAKNR